MAPHCQIQQTLPFSFFLPFFALGAEDQSLSLSLGMPLPLSALSMSPLGVCCLLDISCCPHSLGRGENPHSLVMSAPTPLTEMAGLISLCWCNEWLRLMLTSGKLLGTMGLKVQELLSGCQERSRPQLSELGYPQHQMSERPLFNQARVVRNLSDAHTSSQDSLTGKLQWKEQEEGKKVVLEYASASKTRTASLFLLRLCEQPNRGTCFPVPPQTTSVGLDVSRLMQNYIFYGTGSFWT